MEILQSYNKENKTISVNDQFVIGEEYILYVNEIFDIDGCVYLAISTNKDVITINDVIINRSIISADLFIKENTHFFEN